MTLTIKNADNSLLQILNALNEKLSLPYVIIQEEKSVDEILSLYESPYTYDEIKNGMDEDLKLYKQGNLQTKALGENWK